MSSSREKLTARIPRRERGKRRVAALLESAASLFAEKGYDAVTMTEVAARAGAPIGSLYQFFPGKEALADALLERFGARLHDALDAIAERAAAQSVPELADTLLNLLAGFQEERAAARTLIESRQEASARAAELKHSLHRQVARILRARAPGLSPERADTVARVVVQLMKAAASQNAEQDPAIRRDVANEWRRLAGLYLMDTLADPSDRAAT
jgi:AcrR family transcriptional regulator